MPTTVVQRFFGLDDRPLVDRWLQFAPPIQARYDEQHAAGRTGELRSAILVGLLFYNVYNITSFVLLADIFPLSIALRVGLVTPVSFGLIWLIGRFSAQWTERFVLFGILNAYLVPVLLFWMTREPLGLFTFGELFLSCVFANMLLALRFRHAVAFTIVAFVATLLAVLTKASLDLSLRFAFAVQIATVCIFALYANYRIERRRCSEYLATLGATLQARSSDVARRAFQDLSRTDVLTGLPNRRHLDERLGEWCALPEAMALMMIDIDHFKLYNDALGHPAGDDCLRRVGAVFADFVRSENAFCARFGGEEFVLLLKDANEMETERWAGSLVQAIGSLGTVHPARPDGVGKVTISVGVARRPGGRQVPLADLLATADHALYAAKKRGRNGFMWSERPPGAAESGLKVA